MKNKQYLLSSIIFLLNLSCFYTIVHSQVTEGFPLSEDVIKIDTLTHEPEKGKEIPFDRPFTLLIPLKQTEDIESVFAYEIKPVKGKRNIPSGSSPIPSVKYRIVSKQLLIDFPALSATTHFDFCIIRKLSGDNLSAFISFLDTIHYKTAGKTVNNVKNEKTYTAFKNKLEKQVYKENRTSFQYDYLFNNDSLIGSDTVRILERWYRNNQIDTFYTNILTHKYNYFVDSSFLDSSSFNVKLKTTASEIFGHYKENNEAINALNRILKNRNIQHLMSGLIAIQYNYLTKPSDSLDFEKRIGNLDTTIKNLIDLSNLVEGLLVTTMARPNVTAFATSLEQLILKLGENRNILKRNADSFKNSIQEAVGLRYTEWFINSTERGDLQTAAGFILLPQIGAAGLIIRNNENNLIAVPKLLIGINIFFKPIDKNLKRKFLENKDWKNYLSLSLALTLGKFDDIQLENFFANGYSLLVGPSYRINRGIYFSFGASFYKQQSINPVINEKKFAVGGYASFLVDVDITKTITSFTGLIFN